MKYPAKHAKMSVFRGSITEYPGVIVDHFVGLSCQRGRAFFLSHCHKGRTFVVQCESCTWINHSAFRRQCFAWPDAIVSLEPFQFQFKVVMMCTCFHGYRSHDRPGFFDPPGCTATTVGLRLVLTSNSSVVCLSCLLLSLSFEFLSHPPTSLDAPLLL